MPSALDLARHVAGADVVVVGMGPGVVGTGIASARPRSRPPPCSTPPPPSAGGPILCAAGVRRRRPRAPPGREPPHRAPCSSSSAAPVEAPEPRPERSRRRPRSSTPSACGSRRWAAARPRTPRSSPPARGRRPRRRLPARSLAAVAQPPSAQRLSRLLNLVRAADRDDPAAHRPPDPRAASTPTTGQSDAAFRRSFERDKEELRALGVELGVEEVITDADIPEQGYRVPRSARVAARARPRAPTRSPPCSSPCRSSASTAPTARTGLLEGRRRRRADDGASARASPRCRRTRSSDRCSPRWPSAARRASPTADEPPHGRPVPPRLRPRAAGTCSPSTTTAQAERWFRLDRIDGTPVLGPPEALRPAVDRRAAARCPTRGRCRSTSRSRPGSPSTPPRAHRAASLLGDEAVVEEDDDGAHRRRARGVAPRRLPVVRARLPRARRGARAARAARRRRRLARGGGGRGERSAAARRPAPACAGCWPWSRGWRPTTARRSTRSAPASPSPRPSCSATSSCSRSTSACRRTGPSGSSTSPSSAGGSSPT